MFTRIVRTLPAEANYDSRAFDTAELKVGMRENLQHFNCQGKKTDNSVILKREGDGFRTTSDLEHSKFPYYVMNDTESGGRDSPNEYGLGEVLYRRGTKGSKTDEDNRDRVLNGSEFERIMAPNDSANCDEHELTVSGAQIIISKLFQTDSNLYTDNSVMECEVHQLIVGSKDINCQHVKDICVDKEDELEENGLIDKHTDNLGKHVSKPSSEYGTNKRTGDLDYDFHTPDGLRPGAQADFSNLTVGRCEVKEERLVATPVLSRSECPAAGIVKENGLNPDVFMQANEKNVDNKIEKYVLIEDPLVTTMLPSEKFGTISFPQSSMDSLNSRGEEVAQQPNKSMKVTSKSPDAEFQSEESNQNGAGPITLDLCHEPTSADSRGMRDEVSEQPWKAEIVTNHNYRNFTDPLTAHVVQRADMDEREEEYVLHCEFRNSSNPFLVGEIKSSSKDGSTEDTHNETLLKNMERHSTNVQSSIFEVITEEILPTTIVNLEENFNPFDSRESGTPSSGKDIENIYQVPAESPKRSTNNPFSDCEVENVDMDKNCESIDQQPANNPFAVSEVQNSSEAKVIQSSDQQPELNHKGNSYNPFTISDVEDAGVVNQIAGDTCTEIVPKQQSFEPRDLHNHEGSPKSVSLTDQGEAGIGHTSFSAVSGRITYSGPIAVSGSTSLRSDSSATSTRSFAFPVLQSEWSSSPVRMEKADRRQLRKQRGCWNHFIHCCKF